LQKNWGKQTPFARFAQKVGWYGIFCGEKGFFASGEMSGFLPLAGRYFAVSGLKVFACKGWLLAAYFQGQHER